MPAAEYMIRKKILTLFGAKFHIYNQEGGLIGFCQQKAFKLKEDIRIFTDESMQEQRLGINARSVFDIAAAYDVTDSKTGQRIGVLKRAGLKSIFRDEWTVFDEREIEVGKIMEENAWLAFVRRMHEMAAALIPQAYHFKDSAGREFAEMRTHMNPFVHKMTVAVHDACPVHPLLVLAGGILIVAIEGRQ
ncbi:MAG: hypothetical protein ACREJB_18395 [Planctomycetaceae bacterium]